jgi:hypothetical protein
MNQETFVKMQSVETVYPNSDLENESPFPVLSLRVPLKAGKGACLHAVVPSSVRFVKVSVSARRRGNLIEKGKIALFHSQ